MAVVDVCVILMQERCSIEPREWVEAAQCVALLRAAGFNPEGHLIRTEHHRQALALRLVDRPPRLAVVVVPLGQTPNALALLNDLKELSPRCTIAMAGTESTLLSHEFTAHPLPGAVLLGEWIESAVELLKTLKRHRPGSEVTGTWWRSDKGWQLGERRLYNPDLKSWPDPEVAPFKAADWASLRGRSLPMLASRGYPFRTIFHAETQLRALQDTDSYYHLRPPDKIAEEAADLARTFKLRHIEFADHIFPWDMEWTSRFATFWLRHAGLPFSIRTISEHLDYQRLGLLKQARLDEVEVCIETGNEGLRRSLSDVNLSNTQLREALALCASMNIRTRLRILTGVPGETRKTLEGTVAFARASGATTVIAEPWKQIPHSSGWEQLEMSLTGSNSARHPGMIPLPAVLRDAAFAIQEVQKINALAFALRVPRKADVALDGLSDIASARTRSPLEGPFKVDRFHSPSGSEDVLALRVPSELTWPVKVPKDPILHFGMLIEPAMPGERSRLPISFSIRVSQGGRSFRLFHKILIQALDPDSRLWHWFRIPVTNVKPGWVELIFENLVYGHDATFIPPERDVWAGWARIMIVSQGAIPEVHEETTDHQFESTTESILEGLFTDNQNT